MTILGLLVALLVFCVVIWAAKSLMRAFGVGDPIYTVVIVLIVVACLVWMLGAFGLISPIPLR